MKKLWTGKPVVRAGLALGLFLAGLVLPPGTFADESTEALKKQVEELKELVEEMDERLNKPEVHSAIDKVALGVDLKTTAWSLHYNDTRGVPSDMRPKFFIPFDGTQNGGFNGITRDAMRGMTMMGMFPPAETYDADNDLIYTTKFRLNMKAKVNNNLSFTGRMAAYKVWGDSAGVNFNNNGMGDVTLDGTSVSRPHGDTLHLERAYFNYKNNIGEVPYNFSLGRRPSTEGPPLEYAANSLEGGSPLASIINWQFDGASLNFGLEEVTGIPGASFKLCYGVGFESDYGNSGSLSSNPQVDDVQLYGFISNFYDDDVTKVTLNYAYAPGLTDGFTGTTVMPFIVSAEDRDADGTKEYYFTPNTGGYISRVEPSTNIGDWQAASLLFRTNLEESVGDIDLFLATSWSQTDPSRISGNPFYALMGQGLLSSNGELESHDGYSVYAGCVLPMPLDAKLGLEYNWGSKYWFNFTGAEDSFTGSKLATRGQVVETYYIQPVMGDNLTVTLGGRYYDYDYTGSGNPLGAPVKISEAMATDALFPVIDKAWELYLSASMKF